MIQAVGNSQQINSVQYSNSSGSHKSLTNFDVEDEAIISSQAKILNELEKYNSGDGNEIDLTLACKMGEVQVEAAAKVIKTKNEMMGTIMDMME
jgi:hypothetical protein